MIVAFNRVFIYVLIKESLLNFTFCEPVAIKDGGWIWTLFSPTCRITWMEFCFIWTGQMEVIERYNCVLEHCIYP